MTAITQPEIDQQVFDLYDEYCHGRIDRMETVAPAVTFDMRWCLECHRDPAAYLRPRHQVMEMDWAPAANQRVPHANVIL